MAKHNPIAFSAGHGLHVRGASGYLDEVDEARRICTRVAEVLEELGATVRGPFFDDTSTSVDENLERIVTWHNNQERSLDVSVHLNANETTSSPMGCEVLYVTQSALAAEVSAAISEAGHLKDRGPKFRDNLYVLNNTDEPCILLEVCFVDSSADAQLYNENFDAICMAIAESISGISEPGRPPSPEPPQPEPPEPPISERPILMVGDRGPWVESVQRTLGLPIDGDFGSTTDSGVRAYQRACGLAADGVVGATTWDYLDELDRRMGVGNDGIPAELADKIDDAITASDIEDFEWPDRGFAPLGYYSGVCKTFALAVMRYNGGDGAAAIMAQAEGSDSDTDALAHYHDEFEDLGMSNDAAGIDALRHLFVMLMGLGLRESSGDIWCGRDMTADNVESDTCEAGAWQSSWNLSNCSSEIRKLFEEYCIDPNGFRASFEVEVPKPSAADLDSYGSGDGARYQFLAKYSPAFAALMTAIGMRLLGGEEGHWGPIRRREVTISEEVDSLLREVQKLVAAQPEPGPDPRPPRPPQPEPDAAHVSINVATMGKVRVVVAEPTNTPSGETPVVTIVTQSKGSVAVTVNTGDPRDLIESLRAGRVRHT